MSQVISSARRLYFRVVGLCASAMLAAMVLVAVACVLTTSVPSDWRCETKMVGFSVDPAGPTERILLPTEFRSDGTGSFHGKYLNVSLSDDEVGDEKNFVFKETERYRKGLLQIRVGQGEPVADVGQSVGLNCIIIAERRFGPGLMLNVSSATNDIQTRYEFDHLIYALAQGL